MYRIMFVCYGNICRSPMAEYIFSDMVKTAGREKDFLIKSSATSYEEIGNPVYPPVKKILDRLGIDCSEKRAIKLLPSDYDKYDYFLGMDLKNVETMKNMFNGDKDKKVYRLLDFTPSKTDIADPYWTHDFNKAFSEITYGLKELLKKLK